MCGIFFLVTKRDFSFDFQSISSLYKRGPDDSGIISFKINNSQFHLIQTRLSINGTTTKLPIQDDTAILLVNGEIYNYKQLEKILKVKCVKSDCEILLHLYHYLKDLNQLENFNEYLDGQYSFVIYDKQTNVLFTSRDHIGINSMYIANSEDTIIISSNLKCITNQNIPNLKINHFKPNNSLKLFLDSYWEELFFYKKDIYIKGLTINDSLDFAQNKIRNLLEKSVIKRLSDLLENKIQFGVLLSGGLDSSLVAGLVSKILKNSRGNPFKMKTFSVGINENSPDIISARKVAEYIDSDHTEYFITKDEITCNLENIIEITETYDITTIRASTAMYLLIAKIKKDNPELKVLFSGELSDELFCYLYGYNAPSSVLFQYETVNLVENVYQYDALRANKTSMENGVEIRLPFTDKFFVNYVLHLNVRFKEFNKENGRMEKQLLRDAFKHENLIPKEILYRKKEQFSDGVSCYNKEDNMIDILKGYTLSKVGNCLENESSEKIYYSDIFSRLFPNCNGLVSIWRPKWSENIDPSGRVQDFWNEN